MIWEFIPLYLLGTLGLILKYRQLKKEGKI